MIKRLLTLFVVVLAVMMTLLLFIEPKEQFHILYHSKSYSMMKSNPGETFQIEMFASDEEVFYLDESYIVKANIKNTETSEQVAVNIEGIDVSKEAVLFKQQSYYLVTLHCALSLTIDSYELTYDEASFELYYENNEVLSVDMGEFYYIDKQNTNRINILEMVATHEKYHGLTVSGFYLEIGHDYQESITITDIILGSSVAMVNSFYTKELFASIRYDDQLEDILYPSNFDYLKRNNKEFQFIIRPHRTRSFYFPLTYLNESLLLHRFYIKILYIDKGEIKQDVIDDFPFIRQSIFEVKEEAFDVYYPRMYGE